MDDNDDPMDMDWSSKHFQSPVGEFCNYADLVDSGILPPPVDVNGKFLDISDEASELDFYDPVGDAIDAQDDVRVELPLQYSDLVDAGVLKPYTETVETERGETVKKPVRGKRKLPKELTKNSRNGRSFGKVVEHTERPPVDFRKMTKLDQIRHQRLTGWSVNNHRREHVPRKTSNYYKELADHKLNSIVDTDAPQDRLNPKKSEVIYMAKDKRDPDEDLKTEENALISDNDNDATFEEIRKDQTSHIMGDDIIHDSGFRDDKGSRIGIDLSTLKTDISNDDYNMIMNGVEALTPMQYSEARRMLFHFCFELKTPGWDTSVSDWQNRVIERSNNANNLTYNKLKNIVMLRDVDVSNSGTITDTPFKKLLRYFYVRYYRYGAMLSSDQYINGHIGMKGSDIDMAALAGNNSDINIGLIKLKSQFPLDCIDMENLRVTVISMANLAYNGGYNAKIHKFPTQGKRIVLGLEELSPDIEAIYDVHERAGFMNGEFALVNYELLMVYRSHDHKPLTFIKDSGEVLTLRPRPTAGMAPGLYVSSAGGTMKKSGDTLNCYGVDKDFKYCEVPEASGVAFRDEELVDSYCKNLFGDDYKRDGIRDNRYYTRRLIARMRSTQVTENSHGGMIQLIGVSLDRESFWTVSDTMGVKRFVNVTPKNVGESEFLNQLSDLGLTIEELEENDYMARLTYLGLGSSGVSADRVHVKLIKITREKDRLKKTLDKLTSNHAKVYRDLGMIVFGNKTDAVKFLNSCDGNVDEKLESMEQMEHDRSEKAKLIRKFKEGLYATLGTITSVAVIAVVKNMVDSMADKSENVNKKEDNTMSDSKFQIPTGFLPPVFKDFASMVYQGATFMSGMCDETDMSGTEDPVSPAAPKVGKLKKIAEFIKSAKIVVAVVKFFKGTKDKLKDDDTKSFWKGVGSRIKDIFFGAGDWIKRGYQFGAGLMARFLKFISEILSKSLPDVEVPVDASDPTAA